MFQDRTAPNNAAPAQQAAPPTAVVPESDSTSNARPPGPLILPVPGAASEGSATTAPAVPPGPAVHGPQSALPNSMHDIAAPNPAPAAAPAPLPQQQSWLQNYGGDITGALPRRVPPQAQPPADIAAAPPAASAPAMVNEKLPATIGGPRLRAAAIAGDAAAEFEVASRFAEGHGVPPNDEQAMRWLELAAKQGLAPAQFRLGGFYEKGIVVKKDLAVARDFYAAAAAKGNGKAMHNLAVLYAEGINGPADYRTAAAWFRQAADHGIKDSQYNLAILYARGIGVEQNYAESYKWFALAASGGDADAAKKRDEIATHLDAQALATAKLAVQKWSAEPQPEDAVSVRTPPGGWDVAEHAEKAKGRAAAAKPVSLQPKFN
jgi:localization factor PodJL